MDDAPSITGTKHLAQRRGTENGFVIHDKGERIIDIGDSRSGSFGGAVRWAGLSDVVPHILRHTCGTWMAQRGVSLHQIGGWLGHNDSRTTQLYAHHHPDFMGDALAAFDRKQNR